MAFLYVVYRREASIYASSAFDNIRRIGKFNPKNKNLSGNAVGRKALVVNLRIAGRVDLQYLQATVDAPYPRYCLPNVHESLLGEFRRVHQDTPSLESLQPHTSIPQVDLLLVRDSPLRQADGLQVCADVLLSRVMRTPVTLEGLGQLLQRRAAERLQVVHVLSQEIFEEIALLYPLGEQETELFRTLGKNILQHEVLDVALTPFQVVVVLLEPYVAGAALLGYLPGGLEEEALLGEGIEVHDRDLLDDELGRTEAHESLEVYHCRLHLANWPPLL
ncbi:unnamed protein product [Nezara viridula]|uniref:Uncharacterized protein n=1 Tax=Nezara viridula TaxID=85310 RepID=A0A9P0HAD0_NEZVI|nr:unnamed protein product [Nezara viridula]